MQGLVDFTINEFSFAEFQSSFVTTNYSEQETLSHFKFCFSAALKVNSAVLQFECLCFLLFKDTFVSAVLALLIIISVYRPQVFSVDKQFNPLNTRSIVFAS